MFGHWKLINCAICHTRIRLSFKIHVNLIILCVYIKVKPFFSLLVNEIIPATLITQCENNIF